MATTFTEIADVTGGSPVRPRGVLAMASPAPAGWEAGGIQVSQLCPSPIIRDKCITLAPDEPGRPERSEFQAFLIEQGSTCSTISSDDREREARQGLESSTDYALGVTLLNGIANAGAVSLDDADDLGSFSGAVAAVAALECAAADGAFGQEYMLHASPGAAAYLASAGVMSDAGRSPSGAVWIVSSGYSCEEDGDAMRIWATGRVWAAAGEVTTYESVNRRTNVREAWAARSAIVGFNTCINLTATFTPATGGGSDVDPEARAQIEDLQQELAGLQADLAGKADAQHVHATGDVTSGTFTEARIPSLAISKTTGLQAELDGKADAQHVHATGDVTSGTFTAARIPSLAISKTTGLQAELDGKVTSVVAGDGIAVDATDPANPIIATA